MTGSCAGFRRRKVLAPSLQVVTMRRSPRSTPHCQKVMDSSSAPIRMWRSTTVAAILSVGLMACGNAQAGTAQAGEADSTVQDWETEPKLWVPHAILIPRSSPPVAATDSATDSAKADTTKADSLKADSGGADSARSNATAARPVKVDSSSKSAIKVTAPAKPPRGLFNISPRDSALWPV